ncbi:MAG: metal ABC transporter substrate-binding protein [Chloroflexi bacterium]|nr:metal ABC transporter substrate-binding protein [Chloroflexota bacterium]
MFALRRRLGHTFRWWVPIALLGLAAAACAAPAASPAASGTPGAKLRIVASTSIIADLARQVAGEAADVASILPVGADPHDFEPTAADVERIGSAQVILINGLDLEPWFGRLKANAGGSAQVLEVSKGVKTRHPAHPGAGQKNDHGDDGHDHAADPHVWQSPANAKTMTENIRNLLASVDKARSGSYFERTKQYNKQLDDLDGWIKSEIATIPQARRKMVTNHEAFGYYTDRYGITLVGSVLPSSGASAEPSAQEIAALTTKLRAEQVPAIFTENTFNPKLAERLASDAGMKVVTSLYSDALGAPGGGADSYLGMLRANTEAIVQALK